MQNGVLVILEDEWILGYKLHLVCNTDPSSIIVPLIADVTTANVPNNKVYPDLTSTSTSCLSSEMIKKVHFMVADSGYDDYDLLCRLTQHI